MAAPKRKPHVVDNTAETRGKMKKLTLKGKNQHKKRNGINKKVKFVSDVKYDSSEEEMVSEDMERGEDSGAESDSARDIKLKLALQNEDESESAKEPGNAGWADAMAKILGSKAPKDKPVLLAKAKMDRDTSLVVEDGRPAKTEVEVVPESEAVETTTTTAKLSLDERRKLERKRRYEQREKKAQWLTMAREKPTVTERDRERALARIATKGVVQLFNAVKVQQQALDTKLKEVGGSERKRERLMKTVTKGAFLDVLKGKARSIQVDSEVKNLKPKKDQSDAAPTWHILRDDFMLGAKMKDWDKRNDDEDGNSDDDMT